MIFVLFAILCTRGAAQTSRDDWKLKPFDLERILTNTLANAPLSNSERSEIFKRIDHKTVHDSFTDAQRAEERATVLASRVGFIHLAADGSEQIVVQGPRMFCGAPFNCSYWIYVRDKGGLRPVLESGGNLFLLKKTSMRGYYDVAFGWHMSAREVSYTDYRWNGSKYARADCYSVEWPWDALGKDPQKITACP